MSSADLVTNCDKIGTLRVSQNQVFVRYVIHFTSKEIEMRTERFASFGVVFFLSVYTFINGWANQSGDGYGAGLVLVRPIASNLVGGLDNCTNINDLENVNCGKADPNGEECTLTYSDCAKGGKGQTKTNKCGVDLTKTEVCQKSGNNCSAHYNLVVLPTLTDPCNPVQNPE
jgi:hypothetical protein